MNAMNKLIVFITLFFFSFTPSNAGTYFVDLNFVINQSNAGKKVNKSLKDQLDKGIKKLQVTEKQLQNEEREIIQQKKIISNEDYKLKISSLREKVTKLQKNRDSLLESVSKKRKKARDKLLETLNPIIKDYMQQNNIKIVLDKKSVLLADEKLDITKNILDLLNSKLKSIKLD